jgi:predicted PurR-regulated permease PerM
MWRVVARGILLAAAITPAVDRLTMVRGSRRFQIGRGVAAVAVSLGGAIVLVLASVAVFSSAIPDLVFLGKNLPAYATRVQAALQDLAAANPELAAQIAGALPSVSDIAGPAVGVLTQAPRLLSYAAGAFSTVVRVAFTLFLALYLTIDGERIRRYTIQFLPSARQEQVFELTERIGLRLGAWARGEAFLGVIIGGMTWPSWSSNWRTISSSRG